jgi:hypothetical protein
MEAVRSSEKSEHTSSTWHINPEEESHLNSRNVAGFFLMKCGDRSVTEFVFTPNLVH